MHFFFSFWGHIPVPHGLPAELWAPMHFFFSFWGHIPVPHGLPAELWAHIYIYILPHRISSVNTFPEKERLKIETLL